MNKRFLIFLVIPFMILSCDEKTQTVEQPGKIEKTVKTVVPKELVTLASTQANRHATMPLK